MSTSDIPSILYEWVLELRTKSGFQNLDIEPSYRNSHIASVSVMYNSSWSDSRPLGTDNWMMLGPRLIVIASRHKITDIAFDLTNPQFFHDLEELVREKWEVNG